MGTLDAMILQMFFERRTVMARYLFVFLLGILLLTGLPPAPVMADTQSVVLGTGFSFWSLVLAPAPPLKSNELFAAHSAIKSFFRFEPLTQEFQFQLRLPDGQLFGNDILLNPGQGYIMDSLSADTLEIVGTAMAAPARRELYNGFILTGFPDIGLQRTAGEVMNAYYEVSSIFRWDSDKSSFAFHIRLDPTRTFGDDFPILPETAYFIRASKSSTLYLDTLLGGSPAPTLQSVSVSPPGATLSVGATQSYTATANWSDSTTTDVTSACTWEAVTSGGTGTFSGATFTAVTAGSVRIVATYQTVAGETTMNVISATGVQPGINVFTPLSSTTRKLATLDLFQSNEEGIVILYEGATTDSTYTFTFEGKTAGAAPPLLSMSPPLAFPGADPACAVDIRNRGLEKITLPLAQASGGIRAPSRAPLRAPTVGVSQQFWSLNSLNWPPSAADWTQVTATCRAVGQHCYMFEDDLTPTGYEKFPASAWAELSAAFDNEIYPADTTTFGSEPNPGIDGESKVFILFTWNVNKQRASGYFDSTNEMTQAQADTLTGGIYRSNVKEIFFMQVPTTYDNWSTSLKNHILGVLSHEFLHMIVYNQHVMSGGSSSNEEDWLNEGLAQVAQDVSGYGYQKGTLSFVISPFLSSTGSYSLTNFTFSLGQYGMSYLFCRYLADQGANLKNLVSTTRRGVANVEAVLGQPFADLFRDWCITLYNSGTGVSTEAKYNYSTINIRTTQADGTTLFGPQYYSQRNTWPFNASGSLRGTGVRYFRVYGGTGVSRQLEFLGSSSGQTGTAIVRKNQ